MTDSSAMEIDVHANGQPPPDAARLRVLASGSAGNCSVLEWAEQGLTRRCLIDLGLSPRRVRRCLGVAPREPLDVTDALVTHFDSDHFYAGWARALPRGVRVHVHRRHAAWARNFLPGRDLNVERDEFELGPVAAARTALVSHDEKGSAAFRIDFACGASVAYATDLGRASAALIDLFRGVDVLAIESNYCPRKQVASSRPESLKDRIMGGRGHLSNEQSAAAVAAIGPRRHVVLLHLSRECNEPRLAAAAHAAAGCPVTISRQDTPTDWIAVPAGPGVPRVRLRQPSLFEAGARTATA